MPKRGETCDCGVLENASKEPGSHVEWDERLNEFHIADANGGHLTIYFCPFCGGAVPKSRRSSLFAHVTHQEEARIFGLFSGIRTVSDVIARFGQPDEEREIALGVRSEGRDGEPEHGDAFRGLVYKHLSPVADIVFRVGCGETVRGTWNQKHVGDEQSG